MVMAASMVAMMVPGAAPFFVAYGRDTRRPAAIAVTAAVYVAVWAAIGLAVDSLMSQVMMPASLALDAAALAFAILYTFAPWSRAAHARCIEMCRRMPRRGALVEGATYAACCVACTAGIMVALVVVGMANPLVMVAGAALMVAYKLNGYSAVIRDWQAPQSRQ